MLEHLPKSVKRFSGKDAKNTKIRAVG